MIDKLNNRLLEEIEESKAFFQVYVPSLHIISVGLFQYFSTASTTDRLVDGFLLALKKLCMLLWTHMYVL